MRILLLIFAVIFLFKNVDGSIFFVNNMTEQIEINTPYLHHTKIKPPFNLTSVVLPLGTTTKGLQNCTGILFHFLHFKNLVS